MVLFKLDLVKHISIAKRLRDTIADTLRASVLGERRRIEASRRFARSLLCNAGKNDSERS